MMETNGDTLSAANMTAFFDFWSADKPPFLHRQQQPPPSPERQSLAQEQQQQQQQPLTEWTRPPPPPPPIFATAGPTNAAHHMKEMRRQDRFIASLGLTEDQSPVGVILHEALVRKNKREDKIECKYCREYMLWSNMMQHVSQAHTYCTYCSKVHSTKVQSLITDCPIFDRFWKRIYGHPC
ncbi:MAG: hypothetical protein GY847_11985 [Proteobacteria bacterium]|nr:hypothetical protein [Pseudomonadota bacterium]